MVRQSVWGNGEGRQSIWSLAVDSPPNPLREMQPINRKIFIKTFGGGR